MKEKHAIWSQRTLDWSFARQLVGLCFNCFKALILQILGFYLCKASVNIKTRVFMNIKELKYKKRCHNI